jgi:uncharacterized protein YbjT (DUF2867 family)
MRIVVFGGTGLIGSKLVPKLRDLGHDVFAASHSTGVNAVTQEGLAQALEGTSVVVDVMNAPSWEDEAVMKFFETTSRNLLSAEAKAGVRHHVALSVVGTDRLQESGYFRAKLVQENRIRSSGIPYTIVRATQFFEFLAAVANLSTVDGVVRLPSALMQPIAADDVASALVDYTLAKPADGIVEIAGPDALGIDAAVRQVLIANGDPRTVITDSTAKYYGLQLTDRSLTPGNGARLTPTRLTDWLTVGKPVAK